MKNKSSVFTEEFYLSDGGLETSLIYQQGIRLNHFAAFPLLISEQGKEALYNYYIPYLNLAKEHQLAFVLESPTWRASTDWGYKLGYTHDELFALNKQSIYFMRRVSGEFSEHLPQIIISGNMGPRGDGYKAEHKMSAAEAKAYHLDQIKAFALADADIVTAVTLNYSDEAIGIIKAAQSFGLPAVISFTVETDGQLPSGESLQYAIERTDQETDSYAQHYMINCAHPSHFISLFGKQAPWEKRICGIMANASTKSHAELDEAMTLDRGDQCQLALAYHQLFHLLPHLKLIGGCCGTDHHHLTEICDNLTQSLTQKK